MMAGAARIGALHVMLGLDSAQFTAGLAKANSGIDKFARGAKIGLAAVGAAAAAAGAALAVAVKGAIDNADELSKTAQKVGVTTEALSRLNWAAKLSDVGLEQLSTGLQRLSRNMLDVASGNGAAAATAFDALGISVKDASGNLRASDEVFADIADRFSRMPDGAEKTALAMQLLGRAGAEMIPLLNSGRDGLAAMANESDRLGNTISTNTGRAAEAFNDSITRLQAGLQGMVNKIAEAALPTLNALIDTLTSPDFMAAMQDFAVAAVATADAIAQVFIGAHKAFSDFMNFIGDPGAQKAVMPEGAGLKDIFPEEYGAAEADILRQLEWQMQRGGGAPKNLYEGFGFNSDGTIKIQETSSAVDQLRAVFDSLGASAGGAGGGVKVMADEVQSSITPVNELAEAGDQLASSLANGLANIFTSILDGSKSANEAIGDLIKSLGQMALQQGFQMLLGGLFGGGGGFKLPFFADGTSYAPGGLAVVGERGPELVNLPRGSQVIPNHELSGGRTAVDVIVTIDEDGQTRVKQIAQREAGTAATAAAQAAVVQSGRQAPAAVANYQRQRAGGDYRTM